VMYKIDGHARASGKWEMTLSHFYSIESIKLFYIL